MIQQFHTWNYQVKTLLLYNNNNNIREKQKQNRNNNFKRCMYSNVYSSIICNCMIRKQLKHLSTDDWIKKKFYVCVCVYIYIYICTMEYYSAIDIYLYNGILLSHKHNAIFSFATTWMNLQGITVNKIIQRKTNTA